MSIFLRLLGLFSIPAAGLMFFLLARSVGKEQPSRMKAHVMGVLMPSPLMMAVNMVFMLSAFMVGICGSIYSQYVFYIDPQTVFGFPMSIAMVLMPTIGGVGTLLGPVLGAVVYVVVQDQILTANLELGDFKLSLSSLHLLIYGGLLVIIVLFEPKGNLGLHKRLAKKWAKRQEEYRERNDHPART